VKVVSALTFAVIERREWREARDYFTWRGWSPKVELSNLWKRQGIQEGKVAGLLDAEVDTRET
jgi:hypothetical protein